MHKFGKNNILNLLCESEVNIQSTIDEKTVIRELEMRVGDTNK